MSNKIGVKCVFGHSLSPSQHIDVEQDWGNFFLRYSLNLSQHIDVEQDWGKMCFRAFSTVSRSK